MYKKFVERMAERAVGEYFNVTVYRGEFKYSSYTDFVEFKIKAYGEKLTEYEGFIGTYGQVVVTHVVTQIDGDKLSKEEYITVN